MKTIANHEVSERLYISIVDIDGENKVAAVYLDGEYVDELYVDNESRDIPLILKALSAVDTDYCAICDAVEQISDDIL